MYNVEDARLARSLAQRLKMLPNLALMCYLLTLSVLATNPVFKDPIRIVDSKLEGRMWRVRPAEDRGWCSRHRLSTQRTSLYNIITGVRRFQRAVTAVLVEIVSISISSFRRRRCLPRFVVHDCCIHGVKKSFVASVDKFYSSSRTLGCPHPMPAFS